MAKGVMEQPAAASEQAALQDWARTAFLGHPAAPAPLAVGLNVRRQDFGEKLGLNRSVLQTPLNISGKTYPFGLGTHAFSEIVVRLPRAAKCFEAEVGIDQNADTAGVHGSVEFIVEAGGKELFKSPVQRGGAAPLPVRVDLNGAEEFTLRVTDGGDGIFWDQADWAAARVTYADGSGERLDQMPLGTLPPLMDPALPFSFIYGGKPSAQFLAGWERREERVAAPAGCERHLVTLTSPASGLKITGELTLFADSPAAEWVLRFTNTGTSDTALLEQIRPLDLKLTPAGMGEVVLHHSHGSQCNANDYVPLADPVAPKGAIKVAPVGGRSSNGALPFFNLAWTGGGLVGAIGWTGQWEMELKRDEARQLTLQAGQQTTHLRLHPGESIRTPRILLVSWQGEDRMRGHNLLRRLLLAHYVPRLNGEVVTPPMAQNTWFMFNTGNDVNEANQLDLIPKMHKLGVESFWLDAGWFEGGWPAGAGNWTPKKAAFPNGLRPLGDAAKKHGMGFILWFEPERVTAQSQIAREHPQWCLKAGEGDRLLNLGSVETRQWLADFLIKRIKEWGVTVYRNDFNFDPLPFWQAADAKESPAGERQGISESRYVEGLYWVWDELRRQVPGLALDNCASGGRRIDLELISRSYALSRSDTPCCGRPQPAWDQAQTAGLNLYYPLHTTLIWGLDPYAGRSATTMGTSLSMDTRDPHFDAAQGKKGIAEAKMLRPDWLGDYYPLTKITTDEEQWMVWQLNRPDLGRGFIMAFRRSKSPYESFEVQPRDLDPEARYQVTLADTGEKRELTGAQLQALRITIDKPEQSRLVLYQKMAKD